MEQSPGTVHVRRAPPRCPGTQLGGGVRRSPYPQLLLGKVAAVVDAAVHGHEALEGRPVPDVGVVEAGVEHDDGEGQDVAGVCGVGQRGGLGPGGSPLLCPDSS